MKKAIILLLVLVLMPTLQAVNIQTPSSPITFHGGDTIIYNITITNDESTITVITPRIEPNPNAFTITTPTYSFHLEPNQPVTIPLTITASPYVKGNHTITIHAQSYDIPTEVITETITETVYINTTNTTANFSALKTLLSILDHQSSDYNETINDLEEQIADLQHQLNNQPQPKKEGDQILMLSIALLVIVGILIILLWRQKK